MEVNDHFLSSPAISFTPRRTRRKSRFTYKNLSTLSQSSPTCPLRVIAHIDLDAFYAQCETVRLGIDPAKPLAVQQWQGLIAINYPARAFGLTRHVSITEAKEKCPEIICQHVATWKEGDAKWTYDLQSSDAAREIATRKVSLDPYRIQSRRILATIKDSLPLDLQRVEKASIDEVFLDLSAQVHSILLKRYPEIDGPAPYDDPSEPLPRPPTTALDWAADALVDLDSSQSEEDDPDWNDICLLVASEIVRDVRQRIYDDLQFTCSAGLSKNKMLAKLGSAHRKPNGQTVIRSRATQHFLSAFKFTKIRGLGGKLGDEIVAAFNSELVSDLLTVPLEQLKRQLGDDTGTNLHSTLRGEDISEVNPRTQIKSMLSAKSFRPSINNFEVACKWLRIFVADIFSRLVEEGVLENKRRPKTINLHHRQGAGTRSRQAPLPHGRAMTEDLLFDAAKNLLAQVVVDGRAWPCANLSLSVGGFEDGITNNKGIGGFLVHGDEAKALKDQGRDVGRYRNEPPAKKRRMCDAGGITRFFGAQARQDSRSSEVQDEAGGEDDVELAMENLAHSDPLPDGGAEEEESDRANHEIRVPTTAYNEAPPSSASIIDQIYPADKQEQEHEHDHSDNPKQSTTTSPHRPRPPSNPTQQPAIPSNPGKEVETYTCPRCSLPLPAAEQQEHADFHFAQDLQDEVSAAPGPVAQGTTTTNTAPALRPPGGGDTGSNGSNSGRGGAKSRGRGRPGTFDRRMAERGQRRLGFGSG
ncbi:hypothetical protein LTR62_008777 [Meristemomyces frigidus]|uniref:DNA polymerase eta n=1 Tax=Meristemomyces frigidus TaxID=1508187 RepID=A0AAN7THU5_9PEZI|nr:hypothetical protein LTR62_008777 [Meristemomyces frigidus]